MCRFAEARRGYPRSWRQPGHIGLVMSRQPPSFRSVRAAWADPSRLEPARREALRLLLPHGWTPELKEAYLDAVSEELCGPFPAAAPESDTRAAFEQIADKAHALKNALNALNSQKDHLYRAEPLYAELVMLQKYMHLLPPATRRSPDTADLPGLLTSAWNACEALMVLGEHVQEQLKPGRDTRPKLEMAKMLARRLVSVHVRLVGQPPKEWFYGFVREAARGCDLTCGRDMLAEIIREARQPD